MKEDALKIINLNKELKQNLITTLSFYNAIFSKTL